MNKSKLIFKKNIFTRQWRWRLIASNGKILCSSSEGFWNKKDCIDNAKKTGAGLVESTSNS